MYVYTCVYAYVYIYIYIYVYIYIYIYRERERCVCIFPKPPDGKPRGVGWDDSTPHDRHWLSGYLAEWVPSHPGKHTFKTSQQFNDILRLLARESLDTRWARYPFSRCRRMDTGEGVEVGRESMGGRTWAGAER